MSSSGSVPESSRDSVKLSQAREMQPRLKTDAEMLFAGFTQMQQRLAFYAGIWAGGRRGFTISRLEIDEWLGGFEATFLGEHERIERGGFPRCFTLDVIREYSHPPCERCEEALVRSFK